jgi:membrane-associated phospholipid phosphatase
MIKNDRRQDQRRKSESDRLQGEIERRKRNRRRNSFLPLAIGTTGGVLRSTAAFWFFKQQADKVVGGKADDYDTKILEALRRNESPAVARTLGVLTNLGSHAAIGTAAGLTAIALIRNKRSSDAWTVVVSTGGAMALNSILKAIFQRPRPENLFRKIKLPKSHSFPSGHSLLCAATYPIVLHHLVEQKPTSVQIAGHALAGFIIASVGFSRIYFAVHFPSDVLGGYAAGFGWLGLTSLSHTLIDRDVI